MKKIMLSMAFAATLFVSCRNENLEAGSSADTGIVTNKGSMYKISELPLLPEFAKPIEKEGEERKFTLIKGDGTKLNFEMISYNGTLFGKMRTFTGLVSTDGKTKEKAIMIVGENGFDLFYKDKDQDFRLKGKSELNVGYKPIEFNPQGKLKTQFLAYTKKNGTDGQQLLNQFNKKNVDNSNRYNVTVENSNHYTLLNETAGLQKRKSVEGQGKCGTDHLTSTQHELNNRVENAAKNTTVGAYNIEIIGMMGNPDFNNQYAHLVTSLHGIYPKLAINYWQYQLTNSPQNSDGSINQNYIKEMEEWTNTLLKVDDASKQLRKLANFSEAHPYYVQGVKRRVRVALYGDSWNDKTHGLAYIDYYKISNHAGNAYRHSTLIACDDYNSTLAHECGHNLGANHVDNTKDVMYSKTNSIFGAYNSYNHHDATNISKIKTSLIIN